MTLVFWYALLGAGGLAMLALPFVPLWREWAHPTDSHALRVAGEASSDTEFFARELRGELARRAPGPAPCPGEWHQAREPVLWRENIRLLEPVRCPTAVCVQGDLEASAGSSFAALLASGDIRLGPGSEVSEWMHADGCIGIGAASVALRRMSAGRAVRLEPGCSFERVRAPQVLFGDAAGELQAPKSSAQPCVDYARIPRAERRTNALFRVRGNCVLPADAHFTGSLIVTGSLLVGDDTTIRGDLKARRGLVVGAGCAIHGAVSSERSIEIGRRAFVKGPVVSETDVMVGAGAVIGTQELPTTVSAENIVVQMGAMVHGALWAREAGIAWSAS